MTRARAFHYLDTHYPCSQGQFIRALELERSYARRIWREWLAKNIPTTELNPVHKPLLAA